MKQVMALIFVVAWGFSHGQDPWKNIYSQHAWAERDQWQRADRLIDLLKIGPGSRVADVGCHEGYMTFKLAREVGSTGLVYAVDVETIKLEKLEKRAAENNLDQVKVVKGQDDNPNLPANTLDAVIILDTYHEMDEHDHMLQHIRAALKKGGRLLICEPIADARRSLSRSDQEKKHELAMEYALDDLKNAGFRIQFQKDNFIDRTKQKGDRMWVVLAVKE
ncbi:MAG TPA: methyltransferase domain-containing protein [Chryseosolibacter sp.]|nr:methyltransferase domain-containing protein [Chryseosolibacter sp.]